MRAQDVSVLRAAPESSGRADARRVSPAAEPPARGRWRRAPRWWREPVQLAAPGSLRCARERAREHVQGRERRDVGC